MKKNIFAILLSSFLILFGFTGNSHAILFDLTGQGGAAADSVVIEFDTFDWGSGATLIQDGIPITTVGDTFTLYSQATLSNFQLGGTNVGTGTYSLDGVDPAKSAIQISVVVGFGEYATSVGPVVSFALDKNNPVNFFEIYVDYTPDVDTWLDVANGDTSSGTGYANDGFLIASGEVNFSSGFFALTGLPSGDLDQFPTNDPVDDLSGLQTVMGQGITTVLADTTITSFDRGYFIGVPTNFYLSLTDTNGNATPFDSIDPATVFYDGTGENITGINGIGGTDIIIGFNGVVGPDMEIETDAKTIVNVNAIPEPGTIFLLGLGLLGIASVSRKRA